MTHQINYSFNLGYAPERIYSVNVPLSKLEGLELSVDSVRTVVEEDMSLIAQLMGDDLKAYESMSMAPHLYPKELQRFDENLRLSVAASSVIPVSAPETSETLNVELVALALQQIVSDVDYSLHKNLFCNEWSGKNRYPSLAQKFITIYNQ